MIRRRLLGATAALALVALTGAWASSNRSVETKVACGCCGDACRVCDLHLAADLSCCKACDCPGCGGGSCCTEAAG